MFTEHRPPDKSFILINFLAKKFNTVESVNSLGILWFPFYNTCLNLSNISCLFSGGTTVSSTFLQFSSIAAITGFDFINILAILLPVSYPVSSVLLKPTFWKQFSHMTFHIFCIFICHSFCFFPYLLAGFLPNDKSTYSLTYSLVVAFKE